MKYIYLVCYIHEQYTISGGNEQGTLHKNTAKKSTPEKIASVWT